MVTTWVWSSRSFLTSKRAPYSTVILKVITWFRPELQAPPLSSQALPPFLTSTPPLSSQALPFFPHKHSPLSSQALPLFPHKHPPLLPLSSQAPSFFFTCTHLSSQATPPPPPPGPSFLTCTPHFPHKHSSFFTSTPLSSQALPLFPHKHPPFLTSIPLSSQALPSFLTSTPPLSSLFPHEHSPSFLISTSPLPTHAFSLDHHHVLTWGMHHDFSLIQQSDYCSLLHLTASWHLSSLANMGYCLIWRFCSESTSLLLCCYALTC